MIYFGLPISELVQLTKTVRWKNR